jgi:D-alanine-D-alanine ligase
MLIGLTYDLRDEYVAAGYGEEETAEFDRAETIDSLVDALRKLGHQTDRIGHARELVSRLADGDRWDLIFNICEGISGVGREGQVPAILDVFGIPYTFADPAVMSVCLHKGLTKIVIRDAGLPTPRFAVVDNVKSLAPKSRTTAITSLRFPLFVKPIAEGTSKGVTSASRVHHPQELADVGSALLNRYHQPVLIEEYLPGREFTVGILGTGDKARCVGTLEIILQDQAEPDVYTYVNKERCEELVEYRLVRASQDDQVRRCEEISLAAWRVLGCRDGGRIDLRCDAQGCPQFLEANPLAGMHPSHSDLPMLATAIGMSYVELIDQIVVSAAARCSPGFTRSKPEMHKIKPRKGADLRHAL